MTNTYHVLNFHMLKMLFKLESNTRHYCVFTSSIDSRAGQAKNLFFYTEQNIYQL